MSPSWTFTENIQMTIFLVKSSTCADSGYQALSHSGHMPRREQRTPRKGLGTRLTEKVPNVSLSLARSGDCLKMPGDEHKSKNKAINHSRLAIISSTMSTVSGP